jgi:GNAT superfamily N-acetyltransferase
MTIHQLSSPPPLELGIALEEFERSFLYPLGPKQKFRISHGREYLPFFRAMGEVTLLVAEHEGQVLGTLVLVRRMVRVRSESREQVEPTYYLCDLKLRPEWQRTPLLARLIAMARKHIEASGCQRCYCVVMNGTGRLPTDYTGRMGVPPFEPLGEIMIMRVSSREVLPVDHNVRNSPATEAEDLCQQIRGVGVSAARGLSSERSLMTPLGFIDSTGLACGKLEDTRRGKRLHLEYGEELLSAHLSNWAWTDAHAGARVLQQALSTSIQNGFPALFAALPRPWYPELAPLLSQLQIQEAPATIFGMGFDLNQDWWVDTAEI